MTFMAGGLLALDEMGVEFDVVSTSGAGMLIGLLYAAPPGTGCLRCQRRRALESSLDMFVDTRIYRFMDEVWHYPVGYKAFFKIGGGAKRYTSLMQRMPEVRMPTRSGTRFVNDAIKYWQSVFCPTTLGPWSRGFCQPTPIANNMVDFKKLRKYPGEFFINAYCLETHEIELFNKKVITPGHFQAAMAMPYIYAPFRLNGKTYIEGSAVDTICFEGVMRYLYDPDLSVPELTLPHGKVVPARYRQRPDRPKIDTMVLFNVIGHEQLIRKPRNLLDAQGQAIIVPLVALTKDDVTIFRTLYLPLYQMANPDLRLLQVPMTLTQHQWNHALDWSYANGRRLFELGYQQGMRFFEQHQDRLMNGA